MPIHIPRGKPDDTIDQIIAALQRYETDHPKCQIDIYRQNSVSIRVRIIDPSFAGHTKADRSEIVWGYFTGLSDDVQSDISTLLLLTPEETTSSFANLEFDDPIPSEL